MKDLETHPNPSVCGVQVRTWGTHPGGGNGMGHYLDTSFFGGNPGHASIQVTFAANDKGTEWIKRYCLVPPIPYEKQKVQVKKAERDAQGKYQPSDVNAHEEEVYVVTFSWFPAGYDNAGYALNASFNQDSLYEREGVNVAWDPKWKQEINPESRVHQGKVSSTEMVYGPLSVIHGRNLSQTTYSDLMGAIQTTLRLEKDIESLKIILKKMKKKASEKEGYQLSQNDILILGRYFPHWGRTYSVQNHQITPDMLNKIIEDIKLKLNSTSEENHKLSEQIKKEKKYAENEALEELKKQEKEINTLAQGLAKGISNDLPQYKENYLVQELLDPKSTLLEDLEEDEFVKGASFKVDSACFEHFERLAPGHRSQDISQKITLTEIRNMLSVVRKQVESVRNKYEKMKQDRMILDKLSEWKSLRNALLEMRRNSNWGINNPKLLKKIHDGFTKLSREGGATPKEVQDMLKKVEVMLEKADKEIKELNEKYLEMQASSNTLEHYAYENYLTVGTPADNVVHLPLNQHSQENQGHPQGMDVESMLEEMQNIALEAEKGQGFDLKKNNCSATVGRILEAGAANSHLKSQFNNKALGALGTPQMVHNNTLKYAEQLRKSPGDNFLKKVARVSPLKTVMGWSLNKIVDKKTSGAMKAAAWAALIPVGSIVGIAEGVKRAANPLKSFTQLRDFSQYANSKKSIGFKIGAACLYAPAMTLLAIPAGVQYVGKKTIEGAGKLISKIMPASKEDRAHIEVSDAQREQRITANNALREEMGVTQKMSTQEEMDLQDEPLFISPNNEQLLLNDNMVEISAKDPDRAMKLFQAALDKYPDKMVFLNKKTTTLIEKHIRSIPEGEKGCTANEYRRLCDASMQREKVIRGKVTTSQPTQVQDGENTKRQSLIFARGEKEEADSSVKSNTTMQEEESNKVKKNPSRF